MTEAEIDLMADNVRLRSRIDELLTLVVKIINETPYPEELTGWEAQRRAIIAEIGTLKARVRELECERNIETLFDHSARTTKMHIPDLGFCFCTSCVYLPAHTGTDE